jgi:hypothetical protein
MTRPALTRRAEAPACSHCGDGPHDLDWRERNAEGDALLWWCMGCGRWWCSTCSGSGDAVTCDDCWTHRGSLNFIRDARGRQVIEVRLDQSCRLVAEVDDNGLAGEVVRLRKLPRPVWGRRRATRRRP